MERYVVHEVQKQLPLQKGSPAQVHCYRCVEDCCSGSMLLQLRMVNQSEKCIKSVFLRVEVLNEKDVTGSAITGLTFARCNAAPHSVFGEDRVVMLPWKKVDSVRVSVELVVFDDGKRWHETEALPSREEYCVCDQPDPREREPYDTVMEEEPPAEVEMTAAVTTILPEAPEPVLREERTPPAKQSPPARKDSQWWLWLAIGITSFAMLAIMYILASEYYLLF